MYLARYHHVYVSPHTIYRILKEHHMPRLSLKRYRPGPHRRRDIREPGRSVQIDVKHLKVGSVALYVGGYVLVAVETRYLWPTWGLLLALVLAGRVWPRAPRPPATLETGALDRDLLLASGSWRGPRPSVAGYVTVRRTAGGAPAVGGC